MAIARSLFFFQVLGPHVQRAGVVRLQQVTAQGEAGVGGQLLDVLDRWQLSAREDLGADELHELQVADGQLDPVVAEELLGVRQDGVQQHPAVVGSTL